MMLYADIRAPLLSCCYVVGVDAVHSFASPVGFRSEGEDDEPRVSRYATELPSVAACRSTWLSSSVVILRSIHQVETTVITA
jgi:hypothetical protein